MKKVISVFVLSVLMMGMLSGCNSEKTYIDVYFKNKTENSLNTEKRLMKTGKNTNAADKAKFAIAELIKGPQNENNEAIFPKNTKLLKLSVNDTVATVNFSEQYSEKEGVQALLLRFSVVNTLCTLGGIDGVVIQVEGKPLISETTKKEIGVLTLSDIALNTDAEVEKEKTVITLYFPDENGEKLKKERRSIEIQSALSLEKTVVSELIKGPGKKGLSQAVPTGTKLMGIETKDNVCYVNFSSEFVSKTNPSSLATTLTLYSVVNTLCALDGVSGVQILINGKNGVEFGNYVLDIPYEANEAIFE